MYMYNSALFCKLQLTMIDRIYHIVYFLLNTLPNSHQSVSDQWTSTETKTRLFIGQRFSA
jgi:hypothetical protein